MILLISAASIVVGLTFYIAGRRSGASNCGTFRSTRLLADISDLVTVADRHGVRRYVSESYKRSLGYHPSDLVGHHVLSNVHPEDLPEARAALHASARHGGVRRLKLRVRHADGSWRALGIIVRSCLDDPAVNGIVISANDETELHKLRLQLHQAHRLETVGRLVSSVTHDINNLLTVVIGNLTLAAEDAHAELGQAIAEASDAAGRAASLSRRILDLANGRPNPARIVDANEIVRGMERVVKRLAGANIELCVRTEPDLWAVHADAAQLEQAMLNLAINACDAMPDGGVLGITTKNATIVSASSTTQELNPGDYVCIEVSDTGCGISTEVLQHIFEPFYTTKDVGKGNGIGLATVNSIVANLQGQVQVRSTPGAGAVFLMYIPAVSMGSAPSTPLGD